jgi:uncharacterized protein (DUF2141 family)
MLVLLIAAATVLPAHAQDAAPSAVFVVRGLRSDHGFVGGGFYADRNRWTQVGGQVSTCRVPIHDGVARCVIRAPGPGTYAFAFMHDEDGDGHMNTDALGLPQEGWGFGNDARGTLGAPSFESAAYVLTNGEPVEHALTVRYGLGI